MKTFEDMISMALFVVRKQCGMITRGHIMQVITMNDFASLSGQDHRRTRSHFFFLFSPVFFLTFEMTKHQMTKTNGV